jgi:hypothetical protein
VNEDKNRFLNMKKCEIIANNNNIEDIDECIKLDEDDKI